MIFSYVTTSLSVAVNVCGAQPHTLAHIYVLSQNKYKNITISTTLVLIIDHCIHSLCILYFMYRYRAIASLLLKGGQEISCP